MLSSRQAARRGARSALLVGLAATLGGSCVEILDLQDYTGAASSLCELLAACYGAAAHADCQQRLSQALETAEPALRTQWLTAFGEQDCLANCTTARRCLDRLPVCSDAGGGCGQEEHCCGFTTGEGSCAEQRCCRIDGVVCTDSAQCCSSPCDTVTGTCGGTICANQGELCEHDDDCCSDNCDDTGHCALKCLADGQPCVVDEECCTEHCEGVCTCVPDLLPCELSEHCCSYSCAGGICEDSEPCGKAWEPCIETDDCCGELVCESAPNGPSGGPLECCKPNQASCDGQSPCCRSGCYDGLCCAAIGEPCGAADDCCHGQCTTGACSCVPVGGACDHQEDCCSTWDSPAACHAGSCKACVTSSVVNDTCHSPCESGPPLPLDPGESPDELPCGNWLDIMPCAAEICSQPGLGYCCCVTWDAACAAAADEDADDLGVCALPCLLAPGG